MAAAAVASVFLPRAVPSRTWLLIAGAAVIPDLDAVGRLWGAGDVGWLGGHRAFTHSLVFATVLGALVCLTSWRTVTDNRSRVICWMAGTLAVATHGILDSLTTYGEGVQFFAPFTSDRYTAAWPVLGDGIVRDSIAFVLFFIVARMVVVRRGLPLPGMTGARFRASR